MSDPEAAFVEAACAPRESGHAGSIAIAAVHQSLHE